MKGKLSIATTDVKKAGTAARWSDVAIKGSKVMGAKTSIEVTFSDCNKLVDFGVNMATLTKEQVDADHAEQKALADEAKKGGK